MPGQFQVIEIPSQLKVSGQVTLSSSGTGTIYLSTPSSHQRWEVTSVVSSTNQAATATVLPVVTLAINSNDLSTMSAGNNLGSSWSANQDSWSGSADVGPCDFLAVIFTPPAGATGSQIAALSGVICSAVARGTRYTRVG